MKDAEMTREQLLQQLSLMRRKCRELTESLRISEADYRSVFEAACDAICVYDLETGSILDVNHKACEMFGITCDEALRLEPGEAKAGQLPMLKKEILKRSRKAAGGTIYTFEWLARHKNSRLFWVEVNLKIAIIKGRERVLAMIHDISSRKQVEERINFLSLHDSLTGLYNRAFFEEEMRRLGGGRYDPVGIIVCDVDGLKLINDTLGHDTGDSLLVAAAGVIRNTFRENDIVARIGGDEFAVLLPGSDGVAVQKAYKRLRDAVTWYNSTNPEFPLSISAGFATRNDNSVDICEAFREADNNMYRVKLHHSQSTRSSIVQALMKALKERDFITQGHAQRMQKLVVGMARAISLPETKIADLRLLAQFHDIGKVGISDSILFKEGALTSDERAEMQYHCEIGHSIAMSSPDLVPIADLILKHHEWWNGHGYPLGLKGEEIPLECRILALADAFDAMTSDRPYRKAMPAEEAVAELKRCTGTQFSPDLVGLFIEMVDGIGGKADECFGEPLYNF